MNANENALLTVREVAQILRVPASWVYDHTRPKCRNPLPCVKIGKYLRFFDHDISSYLETVHSRDLHSKSIAYQRGRESVTHRRDASGAVERRSPASSGVTLRAGSRYTGAVQKT